MKTQQNSLEMLKLSVESRQLFEKFCPNFWIWILCQTQLAISKNKVLLARATSKTTLDIWPQTFRLQPIISIWMKNSPLNFFSMIQLFLKFVFFAYIFGTTFFQIRSQNQVIFAKTLFWRKKSKVLEKICHFEKFKTFFMDLRFRN